MELNPKPQLNPDNSGNNIYRVIAETARDFIFVIGENGLVEYVNPSAANSLRKSPDQLIGKRPEDFFGERAFQLQRERLNIVLRTGQTTATEASLIFGDRKVWLHTELIPLKTDTGKVRAVLGISRDITARKQVEESLKREIAMEDLVFEISSPFLSYSADEIDAGIDHMLVQIAKFTEVDRAFCIVIKNDTSAIVSHEWCGPGIKSQKEHPKIVSREEFVWISSQMINGKTVQINEMADIPPDARQERNYMEEAGIRSFLCVPFTGRGGVIKVVLGLEMYHRERTWQEEDIRLVKMFGNTVANALEKKQAEKALRESEENFRALAENANDGIGIVWKEGCFAYMNRRGAEIFGYTVDELVNENVGAGIVFHPDDHEMIMKRYRKIMSGEPVPRTYEPRCVRKDGSEVHLEVSSTRMIWKGQVADLVILRDITERKRAEETLRESEATARALLNAPTDSVFLLDTKGNFLDLNETTARRFNRSRTELVGLCTYDFLPPEAVERRKAYLNQTIQNRKVVRFEDERNGLWFDHVVYPILNEKGEVIKVAVVARDITRRKRAIESLRESEATWRALLNAPTDYVFLIDRECHFLAVNETTARQFGRTPEELIGVCGYDLLPPEIAASRKAQIDQVGRTGRPARFEDERKGMWFDNVIYPILNEKGEVIKIAVLGRDITDRKKAEEQTREYSEHLEELVRERTAQIRELERDRAETEKLAAAGRLAARVAHEINNPLAGIKNSFLLIKMAIPTDHPYYSYIGRIEKEVNRIAHIVRQMFDLYRPEQVPPQDFSVQETIEDISVLLAPLCGEHQVTLKVDTCKATGNLCLPENLLRQVLYNLIINAVQASPPGKPVLITATTDQNELTITVTDQGKGIPEEIQSKILEPFFTTKSGIGTGGLGLGLSVSKGLVEAMKGKLEFETQPEQGTTFRVTIPLNKEEKGG